ncbi:MAG: LLM class flavin-dependent oxidoreductase [Myxococcota bacterium]
MSTHSAGFDTCLIGSGRQLIECAKILLQRGHRIVGVVSHDRDVQQWAAAENIRSHHNGDPLSFFKQQPFDYLFSIINHSITSPEILRLARRGAINFHDSLLPDYPGFHATSWAIIEGRQEHGVTWHEMSDDVDAGAILLQAKVQIAPDDTAFTLATQCSRAGLDSFVDLLKALETDGAERRPQQRGDAPVRGWSERPPACCLIDWRQQATQISALIRGLTFGPEPNPIGRAKFAAPGGFVCVDEVDIVETSTDVAPGKVCSVSDAGLSVAAIGGVLHLGGLSSVDGNPIDGKALRQDYRVEVDAVLPHLSEEEREVIDRLDSSVRRYERAWGKRLVQAQPLVLPWVRHQQTGDASPRAVVCAGKLSAPVTKQLSAMRGTQRLEVLICGFAAYLSRVVDTQTVGVRWRDTSIEQLVASPAAAKLYASAVPVVFVRDGASTFNSLRQDMRVRLEQCVHHGTYTRDLVGRMPKLRGRLARDAALANVAVLTNNDSQEQKLLAGVSLQLCVAEDGTVRCLYDAQVLDGAAIEDVIAQLDVFLTAALAAPMKPVAELPIVTAEDQRLLAQWNATSRDYPKDCCVQDLLAQQVRRTPQGIALIFGDRQMTYDELNRRANGLAQRLIDLGVGPDVLVGICIERSIEMMVALVAVLKAGGAYVPIDPVYPKERLAVMLEDSKAPVLLTQRKLLGRLPPTDAKQVFVDDLLAGDVPTIGDPAHRSVPQHLAYVIFTSGSTGRPKGVMVEHRNVVNFFAGMDDALGDASSGVWLAVTSISFDISVLEIFWTLARGLTVVIQREADRASMAARAEGVSKSSRPMGFGLFYFAADVAQQAAAYSLLTEGARYADEHGFTAVWTPERHFHPFGGLYPNPAVSSAALAMVTQRLQIRAGSVVLPLHNPIRVAEEWAMIDNLSHGRVALSFASGWHANDFCLSPDTYANRKDIMFERIDMIKRLWAGETVKVKNGEGADIDIATLPRPVQKRPPIWLSAAGSPETFRMAGELGANLLTNMLGQSLADLETKIRAYREAYQAAGHAEGAQGRAGTVCVMLHAYVSHDFEEARRTAREPFGNYLKTSLNLVNMAPWAFPAFRRPSNGAAIDAGLDASTLSEEDIAALTDHAIERYYETAGLFGTPTSCLTMIDSLKAIDVDEVACLIDFGVEADKAFEGLQYLAELQERSNPAARTQSTDETVGQLIKRWGVTHLQCTPSMARMLTTDPETMDGLRTLERLLLGGEALPQDLADKLGQAVQGHVLNMYGPTETTIWSSTAKVDSQGGAVTIGRPIANTQIFILDESLQGVPRGAAGELCIGGDGVVRGYLNRPELTAERFVEIQSGDGQKQRVYRTGDLARYLADGRLEFLGRLDHQVKLQGYRIELGEIETVLSTHPQVAQCVVAAKELSTNDRRLVGYVVRQKSTAQGTQPLSRWQQIWDETYTGEAPKVVSASAPDAEFDLRGWRSSYDGELIDPSEMTEWVAHTVARVRELHPKRILEIGCGSGLLLTRLAPHCEHYTGLDFSEAMITQLRQRLADKPWSVELLCRQARDLQGLEAGSFDTVIINSVIQYFPNVDYLVQVLQGVVRLVREGGAVFVGDVRNRRLQPMFHGSVVAFQGHADMKAQELRRRTEGAIEREPELVVEPDRCSRSALNAAPVGRASLAARSRPQ